MQNKDAKLGCDQKRLPKPKMQTQSLYGMVTMGNEEYICKCGLAHSKDCKGCDTDIIKAVRLKTEKDLMGDDT